MNKSFYLLFTLILLLSSNHTYASFIQSDWQNVGDTSIIYDDNTKLEWLSISQTVGESYNYIENQLNMGGEYEGFRFATLDDLNVLVENAGARWGGCQSCPNEIASMETLINLIGSGYSYSTGISTWGYILSDNTSPFFSGVMLRVEDVLGLQESLVSGGFKNSNSYNNLGGFLIRDVSTVPVPAAFWLFGSALLGFFGFSRRKADA